MLTLVPVTEAIRVQLTSGCIRQVVSCIPLDSVQAIPKFAREDYGPPRKESCERQTLMCDRILKFFVEISESRLAGKLAIDTGGTAVLALKRQVSQFDTRW